MISVADRTRESARSAWMSSAAKILGRERELQFPDDPYSRLEGVIDAAIGDLSPAVDGTDVKSLGAGTRRALALGALELYRDESLWPLTSSIILLIEEPEVGLDHAAQRRVATSLRSLPGHSVQTLVVTHSPILMNAAEPQDIRILARPEIKDAWDAPSVRTPFHLGEIADALGAKPSDILLARRFLVTEGKTDSGVFGVWALALACLRSEYASEFYRAQSRTTTNISNLNLSDLARLTIPLPPMSAQEALVEELEAEATLIKANHELIVRFEDKIRAVVSRVWADSTRPDRGTAVAS